MKTGNKRKRKKCNKLVMKLSSQIKIMTKFGKNIMKKMMLIGNKNINLIFQNGSIESNKEKSVIRRELSPLRNKNKEKNKPI